MSLPRAIICWLVQLQKLVSYRYKIIIFSINYDIAGLVLYVRNMHCMDNYQYYKSQIFE